MEEVVSSRVCTKCGDEKILDDFRLDSYKKKDGTTVKYYEGKCKYCKKEDHKKWCEENRELIAEKKKNYSRKNIEKIRKQQKNWRIKNKEHVLESAKNYARKNSEKIKQYKAEWCQKNREKMREKKKIWRIENKEHSREYFRNYRKKNLEKIRKQQKNWRIRNKEHFTEYIRNYRKENLERKKQIENKSRTKNLVRLRERQRLLSKKMCAELNDCYIINNLSIKIGKNAKFIRQYPDLIESQKLIIKIKRECKTSRI